MASFDREVQVGVCGDCVRDRERELERQRERGGEGAANGYV